MPEEKDWRDEAAAGFASLIPWVGPLLEEPARQLVAGFRAEHARNHSRALRAAMTASGLSREELAERVQSNPRLVPIATRVLFEAGMTGQDEVLDALGAALGAAVAQPDHADEVELILLGLPNLRRQHLSVLRVASGPPQWIEPPEEETDELEAGSIEEVGGRELWNVEGLAEVAELPPEVTYVAITGLANGGFVQSFGVLGGTGYAITELGRNLLEVLDRFGGSAESIEASPPSS